MPPAKGREDDNDQLHEGLTDEEIEALKEDDDEVDEEAEAAAKARDDAVAEAAAAEKAAADAKAALDDAASKAAEAEDEDEQPAGEAAAAAAEADDTKPDADAEAKAEAEKATPTRREPAVPGWVPPEKLDDKLKDIKERRVALAQKFDDGDIDAREFNDQLEALSEEREQLREESLKARMGAEIRATNWVELTVPEFLDRHPMYEQNSALYDALNAEVIRLQDAATEAGKSRFAPSILEDAHKAVTESVEKAYEAVTGKAATPAPAAKETVDTKPSADAAKKAAEKAGGKGLGEDRKPAPTLRNLPQVEQTETGGSLNDRLDNLSPTELEEVMMRMPDNQREAYLTRD